MDEKYFSLLRNGLDELGWEQELEDLQAMEERYHDGFYFVALIGEYSAGKSRLLNNLLQRDFLPQGKVETTPLLTYIRYGEEEMGRLYYFDGTEKDISLDDVRTVMQKDREQDNWNLDEVEHMEVLLREDMLRQGMILLDTPGVNTLIERHEQLLANSLSLASSILYVTGHSPSKVDIEKMQALEQQGFPLSFVRTHCDDIQEWEESYEQVVKNDQAILEDCNIKAGLDYLYFISNMPDSPYFKGVSDIRERLLEKGGDVRQSLASDTQERLEVIARNVIAALEEKKAAVEEAKNEQNDAVHNRRQKLDGEIKRLSDLLKDRQERLAADIQKSRDRMQGELKRYADEAAEKVAKKIKATSDEVNSNETMGAFLKKETQQILSNTVSIINSNVDPLLKEINGEISVVDESLSVSADIPEMEHYAEVVNYQDTEASELRRQLAALQRNRAKLEAQLSAEGNSTAMQELQNELAKLEEELAITKDEYGEIGPYEPQMVQTNAGSNSGAVAGKTIGNILDWAMLVLPTGAITGAAKSTGLLGKLATLPAKAGKYGKAFVDGITKSKSLVKAMSNMQKVSKTYVTAKRLAKAGEVLQKAIKTVNAAKEVAPDSILDYLTLEHWGEQIGKQFDEPPRFEEDMVYRNTYYANKRRLESELRQKQERLYRRKLEIGAFKSEQEKKMAQMESLQLDEQELQRELEAHEKEWREEARREALKDWKEKWAAYYRDNLQGYLLEQTNAYLDRLPERMQDYQEKRFHSLQLKMQQKSDELEKILSMPVSEAEAKFTNISRILNELQEITAK